MRPFISIILTLLLQQAIGQTKTEIKRHKIYRVDESFLFQGKPAVYTSYYDPLGRVIKQIEGISYDKSKLITSTKYLDDTLISEIKVDTFYGKVFLGTTVFSYVYKFDKNRRITSKQSKKSSGEITKEVYTYNIHNKLDTVFFFNNDTTIWTGNSFTGKRQLTNNLSLKRVNIYSYNGDTVFLKDCCYPISLYDKLCCKAHIKVKNDTADISIETSWGLNGCILDSSATVWTDKTLKNMNGDYYAENTWGDKIFYTNYKNTKGLLQKRVIKRIDHEGKVSTSSIKWTYYYRQ